MARRIGEALIDRGLINPGQLKRALDAQLIFGGHLGTNLIELGFIDETALVETLGDLLNLNHATVDMLQDIPPSVIHSLPVDLVAKHRVVPVKLDGKTLHVAVIDPKNVGPLSRLTGFKIVPHVAPEIRIFEALEKYYDIPRRARYITICNQLDRQLSKIVGSGRGRAAHTAELDDAPSLGSDDDPIDWEFQYGRSWRDIAGETDPDDTPTGLDDVARRLCAADDVRDLSDAVLDYAGKRMRHAILFSVKSNTARVWGTSGFDLDPERSDGLRFPILSGSIFALLRGNEYYRGPATDAPGSRCFYGSLGLSGAAEVVLAPVYLNDRLAAIFYGDGGKRGVIEAETEDLLDMTEKLALALNMLVLKLKIRGR